jgi:hypothetical protein
MYFVRPRRRHELEMTVGIVLFVLVVLSLGIWALYAHGYLGIAAAAVGGVAVLVGLMRVFQGFRDRRRQDEERRRRGRHEEVEQQRRLSWEQEEIQPQSRKAEPQPMSKGSRQEGEKQQPERQRQHAILQRINEMDDREFRYSLVYYFRHQGYAIDTTPASSDRGADFVLAATDRRIAVQLNHQQRPVDNRAVREVLAGRAFYGAYEAWLITNNVFTRDARNEARIAGVRLIDGEELAEWLSKFSEQSGDEPH